MAERTLVDYVLRGMSERWRWPVKHADAFTAGIADLSAWIEPAGNIWLELKALRSWPKRAGTPVRLDLREDQKLFLLHRHGYCFARIGRDYLLWEADKAYFLLDNERSTQQVLRECALKAWVGKVDWEEFATCISFR
jgi:hypothetical protein